MSNTRPCERCGTPHWQSGPICADCREDEVRPVIQMILDLNSMLRDRAGPKPAGANESELRRCDRPGELRGRKFRHWRSL